MLQVLQADIVAALTPALKRQACEDAIAFVKEFIPGLAGTFAILLIQEIENTIKPA